MFDAEILTSFTSAGLRIAPMKQFEIKIYLTDMHSGAAGRQCFVLRGSQATTTTKKKTTALGYFVKHIHFFIKIAKTQIMIDIYKYLI